MISEKLILTPYLLKKKINNKEYIINLLNNKCLIENTEKIEKILNYFNKLKSVPLEMNDDIQLIGELIRNRVLVKEQYLMLPLPNIELEITNYCNSSCSICPRSKLSRKKGFISENIFKLVVDELKSTPVNEVEICGVGEPLLHPNVIEYIRTLKSIGIKKVKMVTNASLLNKEKAEGLVQAGLDCIMISFHTIDSLKYPKMMIGLEYDKVLQNIKNFINTYKEKVEILITCVVSKDNFKEIEEIKEFWKKLGVNKLYFQKLQSRAGNLFEIKSTKEKHKCLVFEQGLFITWEGAYLSCSNDFLGKSEWSNIEKMSFEQCLNHKLNMIRNGSLFEFCKHCDYDFHKEQYLSTDFYKYVTYQGVQR